MKIYSLPISETLSPPAVFAAFRQMYGSPCAILESMSFDERNQMSLIAAQPRQSIVAHDQTFAQIESALSNAETIELPVEFPFAGGLIGYCNYEIFGEIEPKSAEKLPQSDQPKAVFHEFTQFAFFNHTENVIQFVSFDDNLDIEATEKISAEFSALEVDLDRLKSSEFADFSRYDSTMTESVHAAGVKSLQEKIIDGDIFQAVFSNKFSAEFSADPLDAYQVLRQLEPTTHLYLLDFGVDGVVCGASPEILGSKRGETVLYRPIAGTRYRGATPEQDLELSAEMQADPKENMEHDMLLDLGRNDLGKICQPGTVSVMREKYTKKFANVQHMVSDLTGKIRGNFSAVDFFRGIFPAGTLSGAPKIRAIELLGATEKNPRNLYGGAVGYFSADDNMEFAIAIRTCFIKDGRVSFQSGGGIVADSEPKKEWLEIQNKAKTLVKIFNYLAEN